MPLAKSIYWAIGQPVFTLEKATLTACPLQAVRLCWTNTGVILRCGPYCTLRKTSLLAKPTNTLTAMCSFKLGYATSEVIHLSGNFPTSISVLCSVLVFYVYAILVRGWLRSSVRILMLTHLNP